MHTFIYATLQEDLLNRERFVIGSMFDSIAWRYDFLNHFLSFGADRWWRRQAVAGIQGNFKDAKILDVATGTGDMAIAAMKLRPESVTGIDISDKMLEIGRRKVDKKGLSQVIRLSRCYSEEICFEDDTFDVAMVAFGVRNFTDPVKGLSEMKRVIRKGGLVVVLEFSKPDGVLFRHIYGFYFRNLLPWIGGLFSRDRKAYRYLHESVMNFAENEEFMALMTRAGLSDVKQKRLTFGIASIYTGIKRS